MGLDALVEKFGTRPTPHSKALYWIGRPGHWSVHVPHPGATYGYAVYSGEDLVETLSRALSGGATKTIGGQPVPALIDDPEVDDLI